MICSKCEKNISDKNFYQYKNGTKCKVCKNCLIININTLYESIKNNSDELEKLIKEEEYNNLWKNKERF